VRQALATELGAPLEELFVEVDPYPVASASVAQVHRATLADGRIVAVKVLRPAVERVVRCDLMLMHAAARMLAWIPRLRALGVVDAARSFADAVWKQLDLRLEAQNSHRFAQNFAAVPEVTFPRVVPELSGQRVLCMEFVDGEKVLSRSWARAETLVRAGYRMVLKMIFVDGFVHADLHPGNILVVDGERLAILDLGLVGQVADRHRLGLTRLLLAWASRDLDGVCQGIADVAFFGQPPAAPEKLRHDVEALVASYRERALAEIEVGRLLQDLLRTVRGQWQRLDPATTMIVLAIGVVEGVGRQLAPALRIVDEALPFLQSRAQA
jgi:ubiquinone biosynthesis protein